MLLCQSLGTLQLIIAHKSMVTSERESIMETVGNATGSYTTLDYAHELAALYAY